MDEAGIFSEMAPPPISIHLWTPPALWMQLSQLCQSIVMHDVTLYLCFEWVE